MSQSMYVAFADAVVAALLIKLKALNSVDKGLLSETSVTTADRLAIILGSFSKEHSEKILNEKESDRDVNEVIKMVRKYGVDLGVEEIIVLGKVRRYVAEKLKTQGFELFINKLFDTSDSVRTTAKYVFRGSSET